MAEEKKLIKSRVYPEWGELSKDEYRRKYQNIYYAKKRAERRAVIPSKKVERVYQDIAHLPYDEYKKIYSKRRAAAKKERADAECLEKIASKYKPPGETPRWDDKEYCLEYMRNYYEANREKMNEQIRIAQKARRAKAREQSV